MMTQEMTIEEYKNFIKEEYNKLFNNEKEYIRVRDVRNYDISAQQLHYWIKQGYVRTITVGKQLRYNREDIERML